MAKTDSQILADIKSGSLAPCYLLMGDEPYFVDQLVAHFEQEVVPEDCRDFDQQVLYGLDVNVRTVVSYIQQCPMLSPRKLVLVKEAQQVAHSDSEWDILAAYLEKAVNPSAVLVLAFHNKNLDKRSKAFKAIDKYGVVFESKKIYESQLPRWISQYVHDNGFAINDKSALLLASMVGADLSRVANELSKLFLVLKPGQTINGDVIERNIGISKEYNVFELQDAIGAKNVVKAMRIVNHFAANPKENPIQMLLPVLYKFIVNMMIVKQDPAAFKGSPFQAEKVNAAAQNYTLAKLSACVYYLYDADRKSKGIKSAPLPDGEILKELVYKIMH